MTRSAAPLAIDAGQSGIRWVHDDRAGDLGPIRTHESLAPQLAAVVEATGVDASLVCIGSSGFVMGREDIAGLARRIGASVRITQDSVTSHLGAFGPTGHGASVAAGTGAVALGTSRAGVQQVDGNGWILGDQGSGFWVGAAAIREALRQHDGRSPRTELADIVIDRFGDLPSLYMRVQASETRVADIAAFARVVLESDDPAAAEIAAAAGDELAASALAALRGAGHVDLGVADVRLLGGILSSVRVRDALTAALVAVGVDASRIRPSNGTSVEGAAMLAMLDETHPLSALVERAEP